MFDATVPVFDTRLADRNSQEPFGTPCRIVGDPPSQAGVRLSAPPVPTYIARVGLGRFASEGVTASKLSETVNCITGMAVGLGAYLPKYTNKLNNASAKATYTEK